MCSPSIVALVHEQSTAINSVSVTKGAKVNIITTSVILCGKIVIMSVYMVFGANVVKPDVLATLDLPGNFVTNWFTGDSGLNFGKGTKNLLADKAFASGASVSSQIIGVID